VAKKEEQKSAQILPGDYYWVGPYMVFTEQYHKRRGACCGSGCRHCPWRKENEEKKK